MSLSVLAEFKTTIKKPHQIKKSIKEDLVHIHLYDDGEMDV